MVSIFKKNHLFTTLITFSIFLTALPMEYSLPARDLEQKINESGITLRKAKHYARCLLGNKKCSQQEIKNARKWAAYVGTGILLSVGALIGIYKLNIKKNELPKIEKLNIKALNKKGFGNEEEKLMAAAEKGDVGKITDLIKRGANPNGYDADDWRSPSFSILGAAVNSRSADAVRILVENGASSNVMQAIGDLSATLPYSLRVRNLPIISYAILKEAPKEILNILIDNNDNLNELLGEWTPLMMAAYKGNTYAVKKLLQNGADKSVKNENGKTALDFAKEKIRFPLLPSAYKQIAKLLK